MLNLTPVIVRGRSVFQVNEPIDTDYTFDDNETRLQFRMLMKLIDNPVKGFDDDWRVIGRTVTFQYRPIGSDSWNDDFLVGSFESDMGLMMSGQQTRRSRVSTLAKRPSQGRHIVIML